MSTEVLEELHNLFEWNPPVLKFAIERRDSEYERRKALQAAFYDLHLASGRTCKRVVHVPYLHQQIAHIVDTKMQQIQEDKIALQPPSTGNFTDTANREEQVERNCMPLSDRKSVMDYYTIVTSRCCLPIASSLTFHPHVWRSIIIWSSQPQCSTLGSYGASLQIISMDSVKARFGPEVMDLEVLEKLEEMKARDEDLATWEVSGLTIEDTDAMLGVLTMVAASNEGEFMWKTGSGSPCVLEDDDLPKILSSKRAKDAIETLVLIESPRVVPKSSMPETVTPDSPVDILDASLRRGGSSFEAVREDISVKEAVITEFLETASSETDSDTTSKPGSRADAGEKVPWTPPAAGHAISHELIQKAWGQSVRQNTTVLVLHAGNYEYICLRHRETQTLYISDILHVPFLKEPGYGKVQIGIYIITLEDALRRFTLDSADDGVPAAKDTAKKAYAMGTQKKKSKKRSGPTGRGRPKKRQRTIDDLEWCIQQAVSRDYLLVHIYYDIYDTVNPQVYHRAPIIDPDEERTPELAPIINDVPQAARLLLFLNSELGEGNTGIVHGGVLQVETEHRKSQLAVAAKFSFSEKQRERLQEEWSVYMHLTSEGVQGIPPLLGIFYDPEILTAPVCLLTCHAGVSLQESGRSITSAQRDGFLAALQSIHSAGVAHGDLRYANLLMNASNEVAIIDFDRARMNASQSARRAEYVALSRLLDARVNGSAYEGAELTARSRARGRKERGVVEVPSLGRITRSMGARRQTLGGMTLRPRR